ncbi:MAG: carbonic anhydrase [Cyanobacteria bacterium K_Offshore_surface_m2_239]|nr:carbonic anhydrase [Cyanobacteria bacterium K_Offshore_surface_m2_239]
MPDVNGSAGHLRALSVLRELNQGHERFLAGHSAHPHASIHRIEQLAAGQHPTAAILSCSDSRVPVELLFDAGFGDLFVVRNAGNACTSATVGSLDYGIGHLGIPLLIVMGHEGCGAVNAAYATDTGLTPQLHDLVHMIRAGLDEVDAEAQGGLPQAFRRNPIQAARHMVQASELIQQRLAAGELMLQAAYYTLRKGEIEWLGQMDATGALQPSGLDG